MTDTPLPVQTLEYQTVESNWSPVVRAVAIVFLAENFFSILSLTYYMFFVPSGWRSLFSSPQALRSVATVLSTIISIFCIYAAIRLCLLRRNAAALVCAAAIAMICGHVVNTATSMASYFSKPFPAAARTQLLTQLLVSMLIYFVRGLIIPALVIWLVRRDEVRRMLS